MSPILSENLVKWQRVIFLCEKIRQIKVAQKLKLKIMAKRNDSSTPLILRFTTWLRDNPYGMAACQPDVFIKLDDKSEHPALKNVLIIHSKFFRRLFGLDPDQMHYELPDVKKEVFEAFLDFCYKQTIMDKVNKENYNDVWAFADFAQCKQLVNLLNKYRYLFFRD